MELVSFAIGFGVGGAVLVMWVAHNFAKSREGEEWQNSRRGIYPVTSYNREFHRSETSTRGIFTTFASEFVFGSRPKLHRYTHEDRYGWHHQEERAKYADIIRKHGGICMEVECVKKSRRIKPGAYWHLAHDHSSRSPWAYLGPAHPECNEAEAIARGVTWEGMDGPNEESNSEPDDYWRADYGTREEVIADDAAADAEWAAQHAWLGDDEEEELSDPWVEPSASPNDPWRQERQEPPF